LVYAPYSQLDTLDVENADLPPLPRDFYLQDTLDVARRLLNCLLIHDSPDGRTIGRISETEAYTRDDPACHAFTRKTLRNAAMFGPPGHAYMHLNYGLHWCLNAVTAPEHIAEAVLIRAAEPLVGVELMQRRRGLEAEQIQDIRHKIQGKREDAARTQPKLGHFLCGGPGKLTAAFGISSAYNHFDLTTGQQLWLAPPIEQVGYAAPDSIVATGRIGITRAADYPWRFYLLHDPYISRK
jgi:DNA-3-methyladenine glycosylase